MLSKSGISFPLIKIVNNLNITTMKKFYKKFSLGLLLFVLLTTTANAQIYSTSAGGPWDSTWTWVGGIVPGASHNVVINGAVHTSGNSCNSLTLNASGSLKNTYYGATLTVSGNATNHGTISNYVGLLYLNIGGNITNNIYN